MQFLSEPSGGSDLAGCLTRADRDGDVCILNGSKIWSSGAVASDYAMCLARTNWDVPKHRGLTMFIVKIHQPGIQVDQSARSTARWSSARSSSTTCASRPTDVVGEVDDGWTVASRLLVHERNAVGGGSPYTSGRSVGHDGPRRRRTPSPTLADETGQADDPRARQLVAEAHVLPARAAASSIKRVSQGMATGDVPPPAGSIMKLFGATLVIRRAEIGLELAGAGAAAWPAGEQTPARTAGEASLWRQAMSLGGGSNEIQRNIISERVLGMPREHAADRDVPYRDVRKNTTAKSSNEASDRRTTT